MQPELPDSGGPTLFIDRDAWSHRLDLALRAAGIAFVAHREHFDDDMPDPEWLTQVGQHGWIVLTRDQRIRNRPNELRAAREARLHVFALTSGNLSGRRDGRDRPCRLASHAASGGQHRAADVLVDHARRRCEGAQAPIERRARRLVADAAGNSEVSCW